MTKPSGPAGLSAVEALAALADGSLTSVDLVEACLARIKDRDSAVQAWAYLNAGQALAAAARSDAARKAGGTVGALAGLPVGIKDIIDTADMPTENGTPVFAGRQPEHDASVVAQLRGHGAIILGKTVTTELAFFGPGKTRNPFHPDHTPGGSSSGSAAAVADYQVPLALGTQTAGSIIRPAAYCGAVGFKPTFGAVSRTGALAQSAPLDTIGGYARTVSDIALLIDALSAFDATDPDMTVAEKPSLVSSMAAHRNERLRIAFLKTKQWSDVDLSARTLLKEFAARIGRDFEVFELQLPSAFDDALRLQQIVQFSDIAKNYGPIADKHPAVISAKLHEIIAVGRSFSAADYAAARAEREPLYAAILNALENYDVIMTPAAAGRAPHGLQATGSPMFNALWTYLGMPCISLPLLNDNGLPLGVQFVAGRGRDAALLAMAQRITAACQPA